MFKGPMDGGAAPQAALISRLQPPSPGLPLHFKEKKTALFFSPNAKIIHWLFHSFFGDFKAFKNLALTLFPSQISVSIPCL